ncbi:MAG: CPBP family intramembrane glutamic endopeptidase [Chitinophagaceae bacterium]
MIPTIFDHVLVILLGLVLPFFSGIRGNDKLMQIHFDEITRRKFFISNSIILWLLTLVVVFNWIFQQRSLTLMGFRNISSFQIPFLLAGLFMFLYVIDIFFTIRNSHWEKSYKQWEASLPFLPERYKEIPAYIFMCISAGICEEIMFRGFLVNYFIDPMKDGFPWIAIFAPAILFSLAHYYQGILAVMKIATLSLLFGLIFIYSNSLWIVISLHFLVDLLGGIVAIEYKRRSLE